MEKSRKRRFESGVKRESQRETEIERKEKERKKERKEKVVIFFNAKYERNRSSIAPINSSLWRNRTSVNQGQWISLLILLNDLIGMILRYSGYIFNDFSIVESIFYSWISS